ncbi:MAG: hypothetical protein QM499_11500 [Flavobacteriaceae bacterium]
MITDKSKIAILTTVVNFELYDITSKKFPNEIQKYVIDGTAGMHGIESLYFMMKKLKGRGIEWLIMADEDVIFSNSNAVFTIIDFMNKEDVTVCGVRDGGEINHRTQNPWAINTFFSILNFKTIENIWNKREVMKHQYVLDNEFNDDLSNLQIGYDTKSLFEPYYCFYFWLRRNSKDFLFLDTLMHDDNIANKVLFNNEVFLHHTWYARSYGVNKKHTNRINAILEKTSNSLVLNNNQEDNVIVFKDNNYLLKKKLKRIIKKLFK